MAASLAVQVAFAGDYCRRAAADSLDWAAADSHPAAIPALDDCHLALVDYRCLVAVLARDDFRHLAAVAVAVDCHCPAVDAAADDYPDRDSDADRLSLAVLFPVRADCPAVDVAAAVAGDAASVANTNGCDRDKNGRPL